MPEIENQRTLVERLQNVGNTVFKRLSAGDEAHRVQVALNGNRFLNLKREVIRRCPIKTDRVNAGTFDIS